MPGMSIVAAAAAALAAAIHVWFFVLESVLFGRPAIWARFTELTGATRPLAPAAVGAALLAAACTPRSPSAACSLHSARAAPSG